jgi:hypothetical protein
MVREELARNGARPATPASRRDSPSPVNITWQQELGGGAIEASKIAGHADVSKTGDYPRSSSTA